MIKTPDWTGAACVGVPDIGIFVPRNRWDASKAKAVCATCPLREVCLKDAIRMHDEYAIRGGTTPEERDTAPPRLTETHCKRGHEWTEENTYMMPSGFKKCRQCRREADSSSNARRREAESSGRYVRPALASSR